MVRKCKIRINTYCFLVILRDIPTAEEIWKNLPIQSNVQIWSEEIYFNCSIFSATEKKSVEVLNFGEIAFWPCGKVIVIGFGKTPISKNNEIRLVDKCNVWEDTKLNLKKLKNIKINEIVTVEKN